MTDSPFDGERPFLPRHCRATLRVPRLRFGEEQTSFWQGWRGEDEPGPPLLMPGPS